MKITPLKAMLALIVAALVAGFSGLLSGCASTGGTGKLDPVTTELFIGAASDGAALVLQKNPKAAPVLRSVSEGIGAVLTENSLTAERVAVFVDKLAQDARLDPDERFLIGRLVLRVHGLLVAKFGTPDLNIADPEVRAALTRVKAAIDDTLALYDVLKA